MCRTQTWCAVIVPWCAWGEGGSGISSSVVIFTAFAWSRAVTQPIERDSIYRRRRFPRDVIETCVRWYLTYRLSYRDLVALMGEHDVHLTVWVISLRCGDRTMNRAREGFQSSVTHHGRAPHHFRRTH